MSEPNPDKIPQMDLKAFYAAHRDEVDAAVARVLESGWYILGRECEAFETAFARELGLGAAIGVANGTDAVMLAVRALGVGPGDKVATVSHTAVATVAAVEAFGGVPVLVDIDPARYTLSPEALERALAAYPGVKAVIAVHIYGQPADVAALQEVAARHGATLVEDCAQAHGARIGDRPVGSIAPVASFSFYPTKNLGAFGDGGAVGTSDPAIADRVRVLRQYGWKQRYISDVAGINSRLDELQAAILSVKLRCLAEGNARRRAIAAYYGERLAGTSLTLPAEIPGTTHVYHQYVVRHRDRDRLAADLGQAGIGTNIHYPVPIHLQPAYAGRVALGPGGLPATEAAAREVLSLPIYPELSDAAVERVAETLRRLA